MGIGAIDIKPLTQAYTVAVVVDIDGQALAVDND